MSRPLKKTQIVILAGGLGTRLRPITETIPKPLVEVAGKPFLSWQLADLRNQGYRDVLLLVGYLGHLIQDYFGSGGELGMNITYSFEPEPLGTGGAIRSATRYLDEEFILLNGDSFQRLSLDQMFFEFKRHDWDACISCYDNAIATPVIPNLKIENGIVVDYRRGGGFDHGYFHVDSGVYVLSRKIAENFSATKFQLEQIWPDLIRSRRLGTFPLQERFYDIGTPDRLKEFEEKVRDYF